MRLRLSTRLILGVVIIEAVMLSVLVWNSVRLISSSHAELLESTTKEHALLIATNLAPGLLANDVAMVNDSLTLLEKYHNLVHLDVHDTSGKVIASLQSESHPYTYNETHSDLTKEGVLASSIRQDFTYEDALSDGIFDIVQKIEVYGQYLGTLHAGYSIESVQQLTKQTRLQNTTIAGIELILSIFATIFLGVFLTRGLRKLEEGAQTFGCGKLEHRIDVKSNDEIGDVARSFNQMARNLSKGRSTLEEQNQTLLEQTLQLADQSKHIKLLLNSTAEGIYGADLDGICNFANPACVSMLGYDNEQELVGNSIHEMIHHTRANGSAYPKQQCRVRLATLKGESHHADDEVHWRKDGSSFPVEWWSHPIMQDNKIIGSVVTFIDITDRRQAERALQKAHGELEVRVQERTEELEKANNAKTEFLSRMSHELRTPLNAVIGFSDILKRKLDVDDKMHRHALLINNAGQHLLTLIEEILDLSRIDSGNIEIHLASIQLEPLIEETISFVHPQAEERGISIELSDCSELKVIADSVRLKEVILNLLSNAVKYNVVNGSIRINCKPDNESVTIGIMDTGSGLTKDQLSQLFEPFSRLGAEFTGIKGTGIGMTISKRLTELMHGTIKASSEVGKGSSFEVTLPRG
jgi:PAS domain S-box-containing protein